MATREGPFPQASICVCFCLQELVQLYVNWDIFSGLLETEI
jgi:hypothetical protein